ncbi:hypothetical protein HAX54_000472 [Datura stramonium]|uniref:Uncharacterized protein n=1 Tax=Datura stramonium TaxID=4076 RepID=A0ABS8WS58_DATST|nr:hypothetical protein [Datura stramonium]
MVMKGGEAVGVNGFVQSREKVNGGMLWCWCAAEGRKRKRVTLVVFTLMEMGKRDEAEVVRGWQCRTVRGEGDDAATPVLMEVGGRGRRERGREAVVAACGEEEE